MVKIDYSRDKLITEVGKKLLHDRYLHKGEKSPQDAFARAAIAFSDSPEMAQRMYDYISLQWLSLATPILTNAGTQRGLPISCFLSKCPDSRTGILDHITELAMMNSTGGALGGHWSSVRSNGTPTSKGSQSSGIIPFIRIADSAVLGFSQGGTRRGAYAAFLDVSHPEISEFIEVRKPTGGDANRKCINIHHGVNVPDEFMSLIQGKMKDPEFDDTWDLVDPHTGEVRRSVSATSLWKRILELRHELGEPYIIYIDTVNRALPQAQQDLGLKVTGSNLCVEITLPTDEQRSSVCCLSSFNASKFDEWEPHIDTFVADVVRFLDNAIQFFIDNATDGMEKAVYSAMRERSIGMGVLGFHSYVQSKGWALDYIATKVFNRKLFRSIKTAAVAATRALAIEKGECPDAQGTGVRNMHLLAVAPNASSSIICGTVSPSIEPWVANIFTQKTKSGSLYIRNTCLERVLDGYGLNTEETWQSIDENGGSVQHLDFLSKKEKDVFLTAFEIDPMKIIDLAADRQQYICQAQSLNLFFPSRVKGSELHAVHYYAWKRGVKSLYYLRSRAAREASNVNAKIKLEELASDDDGCLACEG